MPLFIEPSPVKKGRGSAVGTGVGKKRVRRRRKQTRSLSPPQSDTASSPTSENRKGFIGQELVEWNQEIESSKKKTKGQVKRRNQPDTDGTTRGIVLDASSTRALSRHAFALDTRFLKTTEGEKIGEEIIRQYGDFLQMLSARGLSPSILVSTASGGKHNETGGVRFEIVKKKIKGAGLSPSEDLESEGCCIPESLEASASWKTLSDMIDMILKNYTDKQGNSTDFTEAFELTILSTDVALFSDTTKESHIASFDSFWNHISTLFRDSRVSRMRLVVAKTDSLATRAEVPDESCNEQQMHQSAVAECLRAIQEKLHDVELSTMLDSDCASPAVDFSLVVIESSSFSYHALTRQLVRDALSIHDSPCRLSFDLPETTDGTNCCVSFDATYQTFPYPIDSREAEILINDLRDLSLQKLEVVQLVPLSSVDAGLLYGTPLSLRSALEHNIDQFQEMEMIVRVLLQLLQERELGILLRAKSLKSDNDQMFLLMAKEAAIQPPQTGLLFRYAQAHQLLAEAVSPHPCPALENELGSQYVDYMEEALGSLSCDSFNPLDTSLSPVISVNRTTIPWMGEDLGEPVQLDNPDGKLVAHDESMMSHDSATPNTSATTTFDQDDDVWNDSAGVGSRAPLLEPQDMDCSGEADGSF